MAAITPPKNTTNLRGGQVLIPGYGKTIRGHIVVSRYAKPLTATITPKGFIAALHWYYGPFRYSSVQGIFRAVFRAAKYITVNRKHV
jgi:hypothetical protein